MIKDKFNSLKLWTIFTVMNNARTDSRYKEFLQNSDKNDKGVRQGETISPKLVTLVLWYIFKALNWEKQGINTNGRYLSFLRFADDIIFFT